VAALEAAALGPHCAGKLNRTAAPASAGAIQIQHRAAIRLLRHLLDCRSGRPHPKVKA
jgi:hypothetical protein